MGLHKDQRNVTITISADLHETLREVADAQGVSLSKMLAEWISAGAGEPLLRTDKRQVVRALKPDELFVSLPRDWARRAVLGKGTKVKLAYSGDCLIITRLYG